jgi:hypothetical protein
MLLLLKNCDCEVILCSALLSYSSLMKGRAERALQYSQNAMKTKHENTIGEMKTKNENENEVKIWNMDLRSRRIPSKKLTAQYLIFCLNYQSWN